MALLPLVARDQYQRMTQRDLETLSPGDCFELLGQASIGRLVYTDEEGPVAVPVNYAMAGQTIVIRVEGGTKRAAIGQPALAFEVDDIDNTEESGWSVIARGTGQEVAIEDVPGLLRQLEGHPPRPWAEGVHNLWLQITPYSVTGRRLGAPHSSLLF
jgi:nitroimidazol reductase NimA-like FMN-containing flavoprotein (pyridoxamine 5'-phosphate oxidase superfamily)